MFIEPNFNKDFIASTSSKINYLFEEFNINEYWDDEKTNEVLVQQAENRAALKELTVTFVDDQIKCFQAYSPYLTIVSKEVHSIQCTGQDLEQLALDLLNTKPDIVLLDYYINNNTEPIYTGVDLLEKIRLLDNVHSPICIGFSSETMNKEFLRASANAVITKGSTIGTEKTEKRLFGKTLTELILDRLSAVYLDLIEKETHPSRSVSPHGFDDLENYEVLLKESPYYFS